MPIKPENKKRYPADWKAIALQVKADANWTCQRCGRPCKRPDQGWDEFKEAIALTEWRHGIHKKARFILTVAHWPDHNPENCDRSNLHTWCSVCHLRMDSKQHVYNAAETRRLKREVDQLNLLEVGNGTS
jgi:5-methylcytosine-specific restriction endonuclease McrA